MTSVCFCKTPLLPVLKRARREDPVRCKLSPLVAAAASAAVLLLPSYTSAKNILSTNTIFRRYIVTDADAILRYSLPLPNERVLAEPVPIRLVQEQLEKLGVDLRARGAAGLIGGRRDMSKLRGLLSSSRLDILLDVPAKGRENAAEKLSTLARCLDAIEEELGVSEEASSIFPPQLVEVRNTVSDAFARRNTTNQRSNYDGIQIERLRKQALRCVGDIEEIGVEGKGLPFRIPRRYNEYSRLVGRANVEFRIRKQTGSWSNEGNEIRMGAVLDGYSAPITCGNFVDLIRKGYYNNTRILGSQREFFVQMGEREDDKQDGFWKDGVRREIPLEILVEGENGPNYGGTLDELGIGDLQPVLPISGYGAMAMVHSVENANDGSTQFYFFCMDPSSYQASSFGGSILSGSLSTFGYVTEGREYLSEIRGGDKIVSIKITSGEENFLEREQ